MSATDKGQRLVRLVRDILMTQGYRVEIAPNVVRWIFKREGNTFTRFPITTRHDYFHVWDIMALNGIVRFFCQVTTLEGVPGHRRKIVASEFPAGVSDCLLGYVAGRARHFRVYRGPTFARWEGECWRPVDLTTGGASDGAHGTTHPHPQTGSPAASQGGPALGSGLPPVDCDADPGG